MYLNLVILVMVALAGFSSKMLDGFAVRKMAKDFAYILINLSFIIAGTLAAITISPEVVISLLIALILMGKIDKLGLRIGYALVLLLTLALMRDSSVLSPISVVILVVCAMVDETEIRIIRDYRPSMWIGTIAIGILSGNWAPLFAIALFDIGYIIASRSKQSLLSLLK